ncbi:hypothetical protein JZ751_025162, partial [Albula glossodonta]
MPFGLWWSSQTASEKSGSAPKSSLAWPEPKCALAVQSQRAGMWGGECTQCPHHVLTGADAPVPFSQFCEAFGFPAGPSGSPALLLFYELRGPDGALLQSGRASDCPRLGLHPETLLFDSAEGYLWSVLEAGEDVSYIMLYSNYTPCEEAPSLCASTTAHFLAQHPWVRLDLLFSQLYHTDDSWPCSPQNQGGLRILAGLWPRVTLSPLSGGAWAQLQRKFVRDAISSAPPPPPMPGRAVADRLNAVQISAITGVGPAFFQALPPLTDPESDFAPAQATPPRNSLTLLPPPHLPPYNTEPIASCYPLHTEPISGSRHLYQTKPATTKTPLRPINV